MATECRRKRKAVKRKKLTTVIQAYLFIGICVLVGVVMGRFTAPPVETVVTETTTVEVPVLADSLPEVEDIAYLDVPLSHSLQRYIFEVCADEGVPVSLVIAMIEHESGFDPEAVSNTGDYGLMQINEINHEKLAEEHRATDLLNPYQNVYCGIKLIASYVRTYEDYGKALMAYNMGDYGAQKAWKNGIESTAYSENVLDLMKEVEHGY